MEMHRVLKPGGIFIAAREHVISKEADLEKFLEQHPLHHLYGGEHAFLLERYIEALMLLVLRQSKFCLHSRVQSICFPTR